MINIFKKLKEFIVLPSLEDEEVECDTYEVTIRFAVPVDNAEYAINDIKRTIADKLNADYYDEECDFYNAKIVAVEDNFIDDMQTVPTASA